MMTERMTEVRKNTGMNWDNYKLDSNDFDDESCMNGIQGNIFVYFNITGAAFYVP